MEVCLNSGNIELKHVYQRNGTIRGIPDSDAGNWNRDMYYTLQDQNGDEFLAVLERIEPVKPDKLRLEFRREA